jgi:DNA replication protein DnaC
MTLTALLHNGSKIKIKADIAKDCEMKAHELPVQAFSTTAFSCPRCKNHEFALFKERDDFVCFCLDKNCIQLQREASLAKMHGRPIKETLKGTGAEKFHMGKTFNDAVLSKWIGEKSHHASIMEWTTNKKPFLTVLGSPGTGKTYLSAAMLNYLHEQGKNIEYLTHRRFIEKIHAAMQDGKTQHSILPRYADAEFLILDDLGSATCTDWQQEMILELIDRRYSDKAKTIITSNLNKDELRIKLGQRTSSRILDNNNQIIEFWNITDRRSTPGFDADEWWNK